jgi:integrase
MNFLASIKKVGGKETEKDRVLSADEVKTFLAALHDPESEATKTVRLALRGILLTAQRPGEVSGMMLCGPGPVKIGPHVGATMAAGGL